MRTLRLSLAGTVILTLLGGLGGVAVAEDDESSDPNAIVSGSWRDGGPSSWVFEFSEEGVPDEPGWVGHGRGLRRTDSYEWSDPRLPTKGQAVVNFEAYGDSGMAVRSTWLLEGPDGYWTGPWTGFCDADERCQGTAVLTGHGDYEGLYAILTERPPLSSAYRTTYEGAIYSGEMPPMPEPLEPLAE